MTPHVQSMLMHQAETQKVDPHLVLAIAEVESAGSPWACRYESHWKYFYQMERFAAQNRITVMTEKMLQACSWGVLQVMGSVARELGFSGPLPKLCELECGAFYGVKKLKQVTDVYENELSVIAAYNAGSARKLPGGEYVNQEYVTRVQKVLTRIRDLH